VDSRQVNGLAQVKAKPRFLGDSVDSRRQVMRRSSERESSFWGIVWTAGKRVPNAEGV